MTDIAMTDARWCSTAGFCGGVWGTFFMAIVLLLVEVVAVQENARREMVAEIVRE